MIKRRTDCSRCSSANFRTAGRLSTTTRQRNELFLQPHMYAHAFRQGAIQNFHHTVCDNSLVFLRRPARWLPLYAPHALVQGGVCQAVGLAVVLAKSMFNRKPIQLGDQLFRPRMKIPQRGILNLVDALDLPHQQLRVTDQFESFMSVLNRILEGRDQSLIFGEVVSLMAKIAAQGRDFSPSLVVNNDAIASRAWIPARPSVAVRDQIMRRHLRRRFAKKLASPTNRGHFPSLQDELGGRLEQTWNSAARCK